MTLTTHRAETRLSAPPNAAATPQNQTTQAAPSRRASLKMCGECNLCCKVYDVEDLEKKAGHHCHNSGREGGCGIWGLHPKSCQEFKCLWLKHDDMSGLWRPDNAGFVMRLEAGGRNLILDVDPDRPDAWKREPYYSQIKLWSEIMPRNEGLVLCYAPEALYVVTPMEDLTLRAPKKGDILETGMEMSLFGLRPFARVVPAKETHARKRA